MPPKTCRSQLALFTIVAFLMARACAAELPENVSKPPTEKHSHKPVEIEGSPTYTNLKMELENPRRITHDSKGNLILVDSARQSVFRRKSDGTVETIADGLNEPSGLLVDGKGNVYVSNHAEGENEAGSIVKISPDGKKVEIAKGLTGPKGMAMDKKGNLYVCLFDDNAIAKIDAQGKVTVLAKNVETPAAITIAADNNLYAVNSISGTVSRITPTGKVEILAKGFAVPSDICLAAGGGLLVTNYARDDVSHVDLMGKISRFATVPEGTIGICRDENDNLLLVNWDLGVLFKRTANYSLPCPHCKMKIPLRIKERPRKPKREAI